MHLALNRSIALLAATIAVAWPAVAAELFESKDGGYAVAFPAPPSSSAERKKSGLREHMDLAIAPDRGAALMVGWMDGYPETPLAVDRVFAAEIGGVVSGGSKVLSQKPVAVAGVAGRAFEGAQPDGKVLQGRVLVRGVRRYLLLVVGAPQAVKAAAEPFFASFALTGPGVADPPVPPASKRVSVPRAGVTVELHGEPELTADGVRARVHSGLRAEFASFMPAKPASVAETNSALDALVDHYRKKGMVMGLRTAAAAGRPSRQFSAIVDGAEETLRLVSLDRGLLLLKLMGPPATVSDADAAAFFDSVRPEAAPR